MINSVFRHCANRQERAVSIAKHRSPNGLSTYLVFFNSCCHLPETKHHSSLFLHWSGSKFLVIMAACTPSIHVFLGCPLSFSPRSPNSTRKNCWHY